MNIAFLIFSENLSCHSFRLGEANPGVGGTQFTTLQLALRLAGMRPEWQIILINQSPINIQEAPKNLQLKIYPSSTAFFSSMSPPGYDVIVTTVQATRKVELALLRKLSSRLVIWSHHPYDDRLRLLDQDIRFAAVVSVGQYQYYSNAPLRSPSYFIQNLFLPPVLANAPRALPDPTEAFNFVHLGALVSGKGFGHIAAVWPSIRHRWKNARLHVIGSGSLYRERALHPLIPAGPEFAKSILAYITEDEIRSGNVIFHGALGADKLTVIQACHVALQNPTGETEAFPASTLECMSLGIPVIASADYGMWDSMRHFPELQISAPADIVTKVGWLTKDPARYQSCSERAILVGRDCLCQTEDILSRWESLLTSIASNGMTEPKVPAPLPMPRKIWHFRSRMLREHWRIILSGTLVGAAWRSMKSIFGAGSR